MDVYLIKKCKYPAPSHLKRESASFLATAVGFSDIDVKEVRNWLHSSITNGILKPEEGQQILPQRFTEIPNYFTTKMLDP